MNKLLLNRRQQNQHPMSILHQRDWKRLMQQGRFFLRPLYRSRIGGAPVQHSFLFGRLFFQLIGYGAAVAGVALTTTCIGLIKTSVQVENLSLAYLLIVLWLAVRFGRGPAVLASLLAFLSYDFFFIPPTGTFLTDDPVQWISLFTLLTTSLVIGHLTATVQAHAAAALASQQRTARLYALAQLIASTPDQETLLQALVQQVVQSFAVHGVVACTLALPDADKRLQIRAIAPQEGTKAEKSPFRAPEHISLAEQALARGVPAGLSAGKEANDRQGAHTLFYVPLTSGHNVVGALGIVGTPPVHGLLPRLNMALPASPAPSQLVVPAEKEEAEFFAAFCGQIALALEQVALRHAAIHAEALRESNRLKTALLESVTHDLRTPLAAIKAATSSLLEPGMIWREEQWGELIDAIDTSVDRLSHLVRNLLDLSRLEAGAAEPAYDWHFLGDLMAPVLGQLRLAGHLRNRQIVVDIPETLPLVPLDHGQIERVLTNLLENALKCSPPESMIHVQARVEGSPPELEVCVSDQGIGIPESELEAIFEKFYQVPRERFPAWANAQLSSGTGLGLAICKNIIRAHHGRIWAESAPGKGTSFHFTLPIPLDHPEDALPELDEPAEEASMGAKR
jgi:two-component system sensor histidine kinase KdpD